MAAAATADAAAAPIHVTPAPTTPRAQALHDAIAAQRVAAQSSAQQAAARNRDYSIVNPRARAQTTVTSARAENFPSARVQAAPSGHANRIVVVPRAAVTGEQNAGPSARLPAPSARARELQAAAALVAQQAAATMLRTTIVVSR